MPQVSFTATESVYFLNHITSKINYSLTARYGHLYITDSSLDRRESRETNRNTVEELGGPKGSENFANAVSIVIIVTCDHGTLP